MTREEILAMKPGRELDALVAEEVMGFTGVRFGRNDQNAVWIEGGEKRKFHPSRDIVAAWEVVELFNAYTVERMLVGVANFKVSVDENPNAYAFADTAPEAICKAALLAVLDQ